MSDDSVIYYERFTDSGGFNAYRPVGKTEPIAGDPDELAKMLGVSPSRLTFRESDADRQAREARKRQGASTDIAYGTDFDLFTGKPFRW